MQNVVLSLNHINKSFPGVHALDDVSVDFYKGEVHGIVGENGAGKSTLMKILSGVYSMDSGEIKINGKPVRIKNPQDALNHGQSIIFQEFNLVDALSVMENIFLGRLSNTSGTWINWKKIQNDTIQLLKQIGFDIDPSIPVKELSVAQKQIVEIAKALSYNAQIIIMDEPSAALTSAEVESLFGIVRSLRDKRVTVIYISHKLEEVFEICDRVTAMRDGKVINTYNTSSVTRSALIKDMVGRAVDQEYPQRQSLDVPQNNPVVMEVSKLSKDGVFHDISFSLHKREILGFAGLVGSGRTEVMRAIFGADKLNSGEISINGKKVVAHTPVESITNGLSFLTEDRKTQGLLLQLSLTKNISIVNIRKLARYHFINQRKEKRISERYIQELQIKTPSTEQKAVFLSGGNQQKVVLAKWLFADCDIIILDEPTRGIDVGAKREIYSLMNQLVDEGKSILLVSSDLPELLAMSDRVIIMSEGSICGELSGENMTADNVMSAILAKKETN